MALTRSPGSSTNSLIDLLDPFAVLSKEDRSFSKVNTHNIKTKSEKVRPVKGGGSIIGNYAL